MILTDTSIWIDHFRNDNRDLSKHLENGLICTHPFVVGELACGDLKNRWKTLSFFKTLNRVDVANHEEVLIFIYMYKLQSRGLGYVDMHLLASAKLSGTPLWTFDKKLKNVAQTLLLSFEG